MISFNNAEGRFLDRDPHPWCSNAGVGKLHNRALRSCRLSTAVTAVLSMALASPGPCRNGACRANALGRKRATAAVDTRANPVALKGA